MCQDGSAVFLEFEEERYKADDLPSNQVAEFEAAVIQTTHSQEVRQPTLPFLAVPPTDM